MSDKNISKQSSLQKTDSNTIPKYKIILIGESTVGKTSLIQKLVQNEYKKTMTPTIGFDFKMHKLKLPNQDEVQLQIWDSAGQEKFQSITKNYYRSCNAAVIVFSLNDMKSFQSLKKWINSIDQNANSDNLQKIILANKIDLNSNFYEKIKQKELKKQKLQKKSNNNNKQSSDSNNDYFISSLDTDANSKPNSENDENIQNKDEPFIDQQQFEDFCTQQNIQFFYTSAKTGFNVQRAFQYLAMEIKDQLELTDMVDQFKRNQQSTILSTKQSQIKNKNKNCC